MCQMILSSKIYIKTKRTNLSLKKENMETAVPVLYDLGVKSGPNVARHLRQSRPAGRGIRIPFIIKQ